jgi:hypothetical protein
MLLWICHNTANETTNSLHSNPSLQLKIILYLNISYWNQHNRFPAYILHRSSTRFKGVYQHWYGPAKPPVELCLWWHNTLQLPQETAKSYSTPLVYVCTMFQHLTEISALPGELICSLTTWLSPVTGMELQVPGCGMEAAAILQCTIIFCSLCFRSVRFHAFYFVMNFVVVG